MGRTEEAIAAFQQAVNLWPNYLAAHAYLAVLYSELGREEEARAEVAAILRISPHFTLEGMKQRWTFKDPATKERLLAALRKAGLK